MKNHGNTWTPEEEQECYDNIKAGTSFDDIASKLERSVGAIRSRAAKLNLLDNKKNVLSPLPAYVPFVYSGYNQEDPPKIEKKQDKKISTITEDSLEALYEDGAITVRLYNCLKNMGVNNISDTLGYEPKFFLRQSNFGRKTFLELKNLQEELPLSTKILENEINTENKREENIIDPNSLLQFIEDASKFSTLARDYKNTDFQSKKELRDSLSKLKNHIRSFDKALLSYNFSVEDRNDFKRAIYEENGVTAQTILSLIDEIISMCVKDERIGYILRGRIGILEEFDLMTLQDLADEFDISRERIRQLETKGIRTLIHHTKQGDHSYNKELRNICEDLFLNKENDLLSSVIIYCNKFYGGLINKDLLCAILCASLGVFTSAKNALPQIKAKNKEILKENIKETSNLLKDDKYLSQWASIFSQGIFPSNRSKFDGFIPQMTGRYREINKNSTGRTGFYFSEKCQREICYESGEEHRLYQIMEKTDQVVWYQEQPVSIPYEFNNKECQYRPDLAVVTKDGYGTVIEVKPPFNLVQIPTLRKAIAAIKYLHKKGIGFILVDSKGRSLKNLSTYSVNEYLENKIISIINDQGEIDHKTYNQIKDNHKITTPELISIMVRNDLALMSRPFRIWKLPEELSYKDLLA